ncbi:arabinan endo-1,5-alpha-L-arabinosidase [Sanguibacter gelidistatuariae]|uniref:Arabinan endo-1,5-alpha-L-arabinosidase n=1 Tax=Sanguibacter gelidistatuariae TaxID=1814289 RepID=A0A1G6X5B2_9MICO|nr:arabinan endo-1,5-alpha-L-arabinosidase [Sanguibacter gelidistatuariae]SDD73390.1 arabinan endo-1,5-alpha-L-arabinosidase [Sanguibacter gelidistatuariae]
MATSDQATTFVPTPLGGDQTATGPAATELMGLGTRHAHDPTVVRADDGTFYMFCTDALGGPRPDGAPHPPTGVHVRTSRDLVDWTWAGTALDGVPAEASAWTGALGLWAPEVVRWPTAHPTPLPDAAASGASSIAPQPSRFHMYYSASTFGSNTSAIGLAVADDLTGPWRTGELVVRTRAGEHTQNAIDAAVSWDAGGDPWLTYGSFFSGIYTLRLDPSTGLALTPGDLGVCIARRARSVEAAVEGAFIVHRPGGEARYVMFASYDSLFSSYNVRVAAAECIDGPYRDRAGNLMTDTDLPPDSVGTPVLVGHQLTDGTAWIAPGHNSVLTVLAGDGTAEVGTAGAAEDFMVHHVRLAQDPTEHTAQVRRVVWTASGWPAISPQPYAGERLALSSRAHFSPTGPNPHLAGVWDVLDLRDAPMTGPAGSAGSAGPVTASRLIDVVDGNLGSVGAVDVVVLNSYDWVAGREAVSFTGYTEAGTAISGTFKSPTPR